MHRVLSHTTYEKTYELKKQTKSYCHDLQSEMTEIKHGHLKNITKGKERQMRLYKKLKKKTHMIRVRFSSNSQILVRFDC